MALLDTLFQTEGYTPHGYCLLWDPALIWLHLVADSTIAIAYLAIPAALAVVGRRRPDLNPFGVLYWFAAFIILCALTHLASIATLYEPWYMLSGIVKAVCAAVSIVTAALVWRILRFVLVTPSHAELAAVNEELRLLNERLELRVDERTRELSSTSERLIVALYEAREADRIKADFMARMSHELRTPLNAIIGFCEMLTAGIAGSLMARQREYCTNIHAAAIQLLDQINAILDLDRLGRGAEATSPIRQDLAAVCAEALERLGPAAGQARVEVVSGVPGGVMAWADRRALSTIILNLVSNAIKYSPPGSQVTIDGGAADHGIRLRVTDRGYGVDADSVRRVFEPFYRAHERELPAVGGSGLGLSLVKMLVDAHGGTLEFESRLNEGTSVTVWLPDNGVGRPSGGATGYPTLLDGGPLAAAPR